MSDNAGDQFTSSVKSIGSDLWSLFKVIIEERRRKDRERQAQLASEAKEKRAEDMAAQIRKEEREFMKAENEKLRTELRDTLKANGMDTSDKNMDLAQEQVEKMAENQEKIDSNKKEIHDIDKKIEELDKQQKEAIDPKPKVEGEPPPGPDVAKYKELQQQKEDLAKKKVALLEENEKLEAEIESIKNGEGLEKLQPDENSLEAKLKANEQTISDNNTKIGKLDDQLVEHEKKKAGLENDPEALKKHEAEKAKLTKERDDLKAKNGELEKENVGLKKGMEKEKDQAKKLDDDVTKKSEGVNEGVDPGKKEVGKELAPKSGLTEKGGDDQLNKLTEKETPGLDGGKKKGVTGLKKEEDLGKELGTDGGTTGMKGGDLNSKKFRPKSVGDQLQKEGYFKNRPDPSRRHTISVSGTH